jgi:hypothetical protein
MNCLFSLIFANKLYRLYHCIYFTCPADTIHMWMFRNISQSFCAQFFAKFLYPISKFLIVYLQFITLSY